MAGVEWHDNGAQDLVTVSLCIQINKIQLCSMSVDDACSYRNSTATMVHSVHNFEANRSTTRCHTLSAICRYSSLNLRYYNLST